MRDFPEADWRILRDLAPVALDRFCRRVLEGAAKLADNPPAERGGWHKRYLALFKLVQERDDELAAAFNDLRRSSAFVQLVSMCNLELVADEELAKFSEATQTSVRRIQEISREE